MKKNNYLILVENDSLVEKLKEESNITFLFPLQDFSIGFNNTFNIDDIKCDHAYVFINRLLDNDSILSLKEILNSLPSNIEGIVFDDIGVLNILLESNSKLKKILFLNHLNCNYESINTWLNYVDSVVPSPDITIDEIDEILNKSKKMLTLFTFGHVNIMYSRRTLITNYNKNFNANEEKNSLLEEKVSKQKFKIMENKYGTVIYTEYPFNGLKLRNGENVLYYLINTVFLSDDEVIDIIKSTNNLEDKYPYKYLSEKKTIFKLKEE